MPSPRRRATLILLVLGLSAGCGREAPEPAGTGEPDPVEPALEHWLGAHQSPDGRWEAAGFDRWRSGERAGPGEIEGLGRSENDVAVTALAVLAFLGAGYRSDSPGTKGAAVHWGLRWLETVQDGDGCFGSRSLPTWPFQHAVAALAATVDAEATADPGRLTTARRALDFAARSIADGADWRSDQGPGGIPPTAWLWMAVAPRRPWADRPRDRRARVVVPEALSGLQAETAAGIDGRAGDGRLALAVFARIAAGGDRKDPALAEAADRLASRAPAWPSDGGVVDFTAWWLGTSALFAVGGEPWRRWNDAISRSIVPSQRMDGTRCLYRGSWDPVDAWGAEGGRVYSTAILASCLSLYYHYDTA